ncbi:LLM class flavin-dependent oxidoreductase [Cellvibrio polysaccharolyticus]|uniref:Luciferase-like monooxygenase n=1 Tax=Cellvibrio polysaccharolyticus TaxID=2082724 RepID=A0A928V2X9_9GAMM|nr:LLM class flavin-dependent oxidoreductase [Cellvibrio polysaccharolyticus]MBE8715577.1 LLM class flavin-dependent oxidoreductase [Cellvibrio polysaccharolyticus]
MTSLTSTAISLLDLAHVRDTGSYREAYERSVETAQCADRLGFTRFWLAEHHNMDGIGSSATTVLIGHIAGATSRIRVGSGGIMLPNHSPLVVAEQFGTLATLYPDRIDLGLGRAPGSDQATMRALRRDIQSNGENFPEQLAELQFYLGEPQPGQKVHAVPGVGTHVPIWLLGSSLFSARLAAQRGLPYAFASHFAPRLLMEALQIYRNNFQPSAVLEKPYAAIGVPLVAAPTDEEADFLFTTVQQGILSLIRGQSLRQKPPVETMNGRWTLEEKHHIDDFLDIAVVGSKATVTEKLQRLQQETGADEFIFTNNIYDHRHHLRSLEIVAEIFKA